MAASWVFATSVGLELVDLALVFTVGDRVLHRHRRRGTGRYVATLRSNLRSSVLLRDHVLGTVLLRGERAKALMTGSRQSGLPGPADAQPNAGTKMRLSVLIVLGAGRGRWGELRAVRGSDVVAVRAGAVMIRGTGPGWSWSSPAITSGWWPVPASPKASM